MFLFLPQKNLPKEGNTNFTWLNTEYTLAEFLLQLGGGREKALMLTYLN